jgi:hypothetical protein
MKKFLLVISAVSMLISCNKAGDNEYIVTGNVKGLENGKTVVLEVQNEMGQFSPVDTVKVENGKFVFKGTAKEPKMYLVQLEKIDGKIAFILENGDIEMTINKDSVGLTKITGTYNNDELTSFKETGMKIQKRMMKFQNDNMAKMNQAQQTQDTATMNALRKDYSKFQEEFAKQTEDYVQSHPKAFIAALLIEGMFNTMEPDQAKITKYYAGLDESLKTTETGKKIKTKLEKLSQPQAPPPPPVADSAPVANDTESK